MKLQFWGVRGYVPTPGAEYLRYGGNTCCVLVCGAAGELLVIDTGTGFCQLGDTLQQREFRHGRGELTLLITHTYWDHILGLPFPGLVHTPGNRLSIYGPDNARGSLELTYDGHVFVPQQPVDLPAGYRVTVNVENGAPSPQEPVAGKTALQKLADLAKTFPPDSDLPADYASQIDHYLYGTPKRP